MDRFRSRESRIVLGLLIAYSFSRLYNLGVLPIFVDEAIHIQWAMDAWGEGLRRSLANGRFLQVFLSALILPWTRDPLWASRFITVLSGALTMLACYQIGKRLYNREVALFSSCLYIFVPFVLFYDRMALADGFLSSFAALTLLWSIALVQEPKRQHGLLLGLSMTLGILAKIPGLLLLLTPLLAAIFLGSKSPRYWRYLVEAYSLPVAVTPAIVGYFFLSTSQVAEKSVLAGIPVHLVGLFISNGQEASAWLWVYWTAPVMLLGILGLANALAKRKGDGVFLAVTAFSPIVIFAAISYIWFPRYILFVTVPFLVLAGWSVFQLVNPLKVWLTSRKWGLNRAKVHLALTILCLVLICLPAWQTDRYLWSDPSKAALPPVERVQYVTDWPSGYGVEEAAQFLRREASQSSKGIIVVCHEYGSNSYQGLKVLLRSEQKISVRYLFLSDSSGFLQLRRWSADYPTFVVLERPPVDRDPHQWPDLGTLKSIAHLVQAYPKPGGTRVIELYQVSADLASGDHAGAQPAELQGAQNHDSGPLASILSCSNGRNEQSLQGTENFLISDLVRRRCIRPQRLARSEIPEHRGLPEVWTSLG